VQFISQKYHHLISNSRKTELSLASWDSVAQGTKESIPYLAFAQKISLLILSRLFLSHGTFNS
jgi:hypothetical protein